MRRNRIIVTLSRSFNYPKSMFEHGAHIEGAMQHALQDFKEDVKNKSVSEDDYFEVKVEQPAYYTTTNKNKNVQQNESVVPIRDIVNYFVAIELHKKFGVYKYDPETKPDFFIEDGGEFYLKEEHQEFLDELISKAYDKITAIQNMHI